MKLKTRDQPSIRLVGQNHDLGEVIREVEKFRRVARQRSLGKYRDLSTVLTNDLPDNY